MTTADSLNPRASGLASTHCPMPSHLAPDASKPFVSDLSFHHLNMIISGACTGLTCLVIFTLMSRHAAHLSNANEQLKIMRIATLFPLYTMYSFLSICFPNAYVYMFGWTKFIQGIALYWFLMLIVEYVVPHNQHRAEFFASLTIQRRFNKNKTMNGLSLLKVTWFLVMQYPVVTFVLAIAQSVTQAKGVYCLQGRGPHIAHLWITAMGAISLSVAMTSILNFHSNLRTHMTKQKPMQKLLSFKMIVGLEFLEQIIFMILDSNEIMKPTATLSYADTIIGIPTMIICLQVVPFTFLFWHAYSIKPYTTVDAKGTLKPQSHAIDSESGMRGVEGYQGGPLGIYGWIGLFNLGELYRSITSTYNMLSNYQAQIAQRAQSPM